jgi:CHAD domain-containing protein
LETDKGGRQVKIGSALLRTEAKRAPRRLGLRDNQKAELRVINRMAEMEHKIRLDVGAALQSHVIRSTCAAFENLRDAIAALETLPVPAIEALQEFVRAEYSKREGALGEFARAYLKYLETPLAAAKIMERRTRYGIEAFGKTMGDYELKPREPRDGQE